MKFICHQIFLDVGLEPLKSRTEWLNNIKVNKELNPNIEFILWTDKEVNELIDNEYPEYDKPAVNNNVIKLNPEYYEKLLGFSVSEYNRIINNNLYLKWKGRKLLNSVGAYMFKRFCKKHNIISSINFDEYFVDSQERSWIKIGLVGK